MDFDDIVVKESPGLCRCCLSEGCYKDLSTEYQWMDDTEIYADMLLDCFDISISQHAEGPNGANRLICEVCVTRLRDACNFKKQVLASEKKFVDMVGRGAFKPKAVTYNVPIKSEAILEIQPQETEVEFLEAGMDYPDDDVLKDDLGHTSTDDITVSTLPIKGKKGKAKKTMTKAEKKSCSKIVLVEKPKISKPLTKGEPRGGQKTKQTTAVFEDQDNNDHKLITSKGRLKIMRNNVLQVLLKSTVMPFRWLKSSYRCFYCYDIFQESSDLKDHQITHIGDNVKEQAMNNYWEQIVYIDISNLSCKLCPEKIDDLYDLIDHLITKHGMIYNKDIGVCMVAFKLDNLSINCLVCGASFYTFGPLLHHTNKDHKGISAILCDVCGQNFKDANLLRAHVKSVHENNGVLCPECGVKFETRSKLKTHQKNQHDLDRKYKCLVCTETFQSHYKRSRHMVAEHKNRQEIKCLHCPKTFVFRSMMMTHLRDTHLKVRNHVCGVCGWKAFNSNRLKNHMFKHSGEKNFKCNSCDKAFTTKKIMRAHYSRMHKTQIYENTFTGQQ
ncbi:PREDICTED: zinc finger protein 41-like isoform X9 [Papilio xuthus]|uniref:Zinc finger protein 41-like isoform X9 n=1 Tax=Papilio xuthus TaxID=66420 RepID=A0AAJ7E676_PAPXU|nr:PREDICTED: zinc finger protein 41-like isoform X9 [Papilio xuthus]